MDKLAKVCNVLVLDIETAPVLAYVWDLYDQNISVNQIHTDRYVMAWAAKWLGEKEVMYADKRGKKPGDDKAILLQLWKLLDQADVVITQNGKKFDSRRINARFIELGIKPPSPYKHWDTLILAKRVADFTSNKLEYLAQKINQSHTKSYHRKYPGFELWKQCLAGNPDAWNEMMHYNKADVLATEELYLNMRAWAPESFPAVYIYADKSTVCGTCGHHGKMVEGNLRHASVQSYAQYKCPKCGAWQKGKVVKCQK